MDIISIVTFAGGLAFFLYGMNVLSTGLERLAGGRLTAILKKLTEKKLIGVLAGAGITIAVQSSSAVTVMLVGLAGSGVIEASKTVGIIMGSNVGTTLTPWLLATIGTGAKSTVASLLKPENFSLALALVGAVMITFSKKTKKKDVGAVLVAFAVLVTGMKLMSQGASPLAENEKVSSLMVAFENPFLAVLAGALFTGLIQSSAASVGVLQALSLTGGVSFAAAIPVIVGQNIGTCVTSALSCIGVARKAKKVSLIHVIFNVAGGVIFLGAYYLINSLVGFSFASKPITSFGIAAVHTVFNLSVTAVLYPLSWLIIKACDLLLPEKSEESGTLHIPDERLLSAPFAAVSESFRCVCDMAFVAEKAVSDALSILFAYNEKTALKVLDKERILDRYEDALGTFLVMLSKKSLSDKEVNRVAAMLRVISDIERLGDHAQNLVELSREMKDKSITFSEKTRGELEVVSTALREVVAVSTSALKKNDSSLARRVEPLEEVIDTLVSTIRDHHVQRLREGLTTLEKGFVLSDMLIGFERISDHCSNIALAVISLSRGSMDSHAYLSEIKHGDPRFVMLLDHYTKKYVIPTSFEKEVGKKTSPYFF